MYAARVEQIELCGAERSSSGGARRARSPDPRRRARRDRGASRDGALDAIYIDPPFGTGTARAGPRPRATPTAPTIPRRSSRGSRRTSTHSRRALARDTARCSSTSTTARSTTSRSRSIALFGRDALRQRDRVVLRGRRQEPARVRAQARHDPVVRARRRLGVLSRTRSACRGAAARTCGSSAASRRRPTARPAASIAIRSRPARFPRTGGPTSRRSTTPTASAPAGRRRSPSGCVERIVAAVTAPGDRVARLVRRLGHDGGRRAAARARVRRGRSRGRRRSRCAANGCVAQGRAARSGRDAPPPVEVVVDEREADSGSTCGARRSTGREFTG